MEYFPLILKRRVKLSYNKEVETIEEIVEALKGETCEPHIFCRGDYLDDECLYEYCCNSHLRGIGEWLMKKVIFDTHAGTKTIGVRLRIATGMLNKIPLHSNSGTLKIALQYNFVQNVQSVIRQRFAYDLPF